MKTEMSDMILLPAVTLKSIIDNSYLHHMKSLLKRLSNVYCNLENQYCSANLVFRNNKLRIMIFPKKKYYKVNNMF